MNRFRIVENRFAILLDVDKLTVREGVDSSLYGKIWAAHKSEYNSETAATELVARLEDIGGHSGEAVYTLGRGATVHALASFSYEQSPVDNARRRFEYVRYYKARSASKVNIDDEKAFINTVHEDLRDGLQPYIRRYEKSIWLSVDESDFAKRALYERAGYSHDGALRDEVIMVRHI